MEFVRAKLQESFLLRWMIANMTGWMVGLIAGGYVIRLPNIPGLCLPLIGVFGAFAGMCIGFAQWLILRPMYPITRRWIGMSMIGAGLASLPAYFLGVFIFLAGAMGVSLLNYVAALLIGVLIGGGVGWAQSLVLEQHLSQSNARWIGACAVGGGLCGLLSFVPILPPLPIGILLGTALYGYITGRMLLRLVRGEAH